MNLKSHNFLVLGEIQIPESCFFLSPHRKESLFISQDIPSMSSPFTVLRGLVRLSDSSSPPGQFITEKKRGEAVWEAPARCETRGCKVGFSVKIKAKHLVLVTHTPHHMPSPLPAQPCEGLTPACLTAATAGNNSFH